MKLNYPHDQYEQAFEQAKEDRSKRQEFINRINLGEYAPYVSRVSYWNKRTIKHIKKAGREGLPMMYCVRSFLSSLGIKKTKSEIWVLPSAFIFHTADKFYDVLVQHEGMHAKQNYENPIFWLTEKKMIQIEEEAENNERCFEDMSSKQSSIKRYPINIEGMIAGDRKDWKYSDALYDFVRKYGNQQQVK